MMKGNSYGHINCLPDKMLLYLHRILFDAFFWISKEIIKIIVNHRQNTAQKGILNIFEPNLPPHTNRSLALRYACAIMKM